MESPRGIAKWSATWGQTGLSDRRLFVFTLLGYFVFLVYYFSLQSPACDESSYFDYVIRWAKGQPERINLLDDSKTPMIFPALGVFLLKPFFPGLEQNNGAGLLHGGRLALFIYIAVLAWFLFCWLYRLFGSKKWYWPWLLFLLDPLIISNSLLLGSDIASSTCWIAGAYLSWRSAITGKLRYFIFLAITIGMGVAVKPSLVFIFPMAILVYMATLFIQGNPKSLSFKFLSGKLALIAIISLLILNAAYQFNAVGKKLNGISFTSKKMQQFQNNYPSISNLPLPISIHIITGYDLLLRNAESGGGYEDHNSYRGVFLNKEYRQQGGFYRYYLFHFFYKTTPLLLLCLLLSLVAIRKKGIFKTIMAASPVWIPPLLFLIILSFLNPFQIGIRHALPVWPFLYIMAAPGIVWLSEIRRPLWLIIFMIHMAEMGFTWPNLTAYTPFWIQPKHLLWQRINDSSLQYCNDFYLYNYFLKTNPTYQHPGSIPRPGNFAVRIEECNPWPGGNQYPPCWITRHFLPIGHYKSGILLYHITEEQIAALPAPP